MSKLHVVWTCVCCNESKDPKLFHNENCCSDCEPHLEWLSKRIVQNGIMHHLKILNKMGLLK